MASVDDKVVSLKFDNAQFQGKINETLTALGTLNKALKFEGAQKGLQDVQAAANKINFGTLSTSLDSVNAKLLAMSTIAITALANMTAAAIHAGTAIVKSLSLDQVISGFKEYETNIGSIQTILANTKAQGSNLGDVTAALDELNHYSDKTIYNFGQMAKNIGTFTAAGVDLDTSVQSIKGIANLAAISGSSADQASTAMYQLSQAIASGSVKLMDWNSVVNAGMGGKGFQEALYNTGQALGTIANAPVGKTFKEWTDDGNSFRDSLQDGWITADVLTTTLSGYTGEMSQAQLEAKGFSAEAAKQLIELGNTGVDAATKVRTFTGLLSTTKEAIGSGWSQSFKLIIGNFEEATTLFTGMSQSIGGWVGKISDARNNLLQGWKDLGGRTLLIMGLQAAFQHLAEVFKPIKEAFREIFPKTTSAQLFELTKSFVNFANALKPSAETVEHVKSIFKGLFSILSIGWEVIKETVKFIIDLGKSLAGLSGGDFLGFIAKVGDFFTWLRGVLVEGGGIKAFFEGLTVAIQKPIEWIQKLKDAVVKLFTGFDPKAQDKVDAAGDAFGRLGDRFESLTRIFDKVKDAFSGFTDKLEGPLKKVGDLFTKAWDAISGFFEEIGPKIGDVLKSGEFSGALDALNTGLLAVLTAGIIKWIKNGFNINIGVADGKLGIIERIRGMFDNLTGTLKAMQAKLKSEALLKIAYAIGILTASVLVLSLIDSGALSKALTAMAVGFGQLMGAFAILQKMTLDPKSALSFSLLSVGFIAMAIAIVILAAACKIMASLSWEELARGLLGTLAILGLMVVSVRLLQGKTAGMIEAGIGITAMAISLLLMAGAVKLFASMDLKEMAKGLGGMAIGLGLIALGVRLMPDGLAFTSLGLIGIGLALNLVGTALKFFGTMEWDEIGRGLVALGGGLAIVAIAVNAMPGGMIPTGLGLLAIGYALGFFAKALIKMGAMSWEEIAKGLTALAGSMIILAIGVTAMSGALVGAIALGVISASLLVLAAVMKIFALMSWDTLLDAMFRLAAALAIIAVVSVLLSPATPAILGLAIALGVLGIAFGLFGAGAFLAAKAFKIISEVGQGAADKLGGILEAIGEALPKLAKGLGEGIIDTIKAFADGIGKLIPAFGKIIGALVTAIENNLPKMQGIMNKLLDALIQIIYNYGPQFIQAGIYMLLTLLQGISAKIQDITNAAVDIILGFLAAIQERIGEIASAGIAILLALVQGIAENIIIVVNAVGDIIAAFITAVVGNYEKIIQAGTDAVVQFLSGVTNNIAAITTAATDLIVGFIQGLTDSAQKILDAGKTLVLTLIYGVAISMIEITNAAANVIIAFLKELTSHVPDVAKAATDFIISLITEIGKNMLRIVKAGTDTVIAFITGLKDNALRFADAAFTVITQFLNGLADVIRNRSKELQDAGGNLAGAIIDGLTLGWASKVGKVWDVLKAFAQEAKDKLTHPWDMLSPSKVTTKYGAYIAEGFAIGFKEDQTVAREATNLMGRASDAFKSAFVQATDILKDTDEFNPTITPVLDLTKVAQDAKLINGYISDQSIAPTTSLNTARTIASTQTPISTPSDEKSPGGAGGVTFQQTINAPTQLSTADIYKQTRNQITIAKEELAIA